MSETVVISVISIAGNLVVALLVLRSQRRAGIGSSRLEPVLTFVRLVESARALVDGGVVAVAEAPDIAASELLYADGRVPDRPSEDLTSALSTARRRPFRRADLPAPDDWADLDVIEGAAGGGAIVLPAGGSPEAKAVVEELEQARSELDVLAGEMVRRWAYRVTLTLTKLLSRPAIQRSVWVQLRAKLHDARGELIHELREEVNRGGYRKKYLRDLSKARNWIDHYTWLRQPANTADGAGVWNAERALSDW